MDMLSLFVFFGSQNEFLIIHPSGILVVSIRDVPVLAFDDIPALHIPARIPREEQLVRLADAPVVAVCHVGQVVFPVFHRDDVPHVESGADAVLHDAGHGDAFDVIRKCRLIAKILKCLRVSFADYICGGIAVEDPDDLEWIHGRVVNIFVDVVIVGHEITDLALVVEKLFVVGEGRSGRNDLVRFRHGAFHSGAGGRIDFKVARSVAGSDLEWDGDAVAEAGAVRLAGFPVDAVHKSGDEAADAFVKPIQFVRMCCSQNVCDAVQVNAGNGENGADRFLRQHVAVHQL